MAGGSRLRARATGSHPRQAFPRPFGARPGHAALVFLLAALAAGCAGTRSPSPTPSTGLELPEGGLRLLYDGRSEETSATHRFRLAIAYLPPEALRLEIYPPVGGARLIVTGDGSHLLAVEPQEKRFESLGAQGDGLLRLVGVALDARAFMAVLSGTSPCPREAGVEAPESCATPGWRFERQAPGGRFAGEHGETILTVSYRSWNKGGGWPDEVRLSWPQRSVDVDLHLRQGPGGGEGLEPSAFRAEAPSGFVPGEVLRGLLGAP